MEIDKSKLLSLGGAQMLYDNLRDEIKKSEGNSEQKIDGKADYIRITEDGKYFFLVSGGEGGEDIAGPFGPFAGEGGGGGGSGNNAVLTLTNENEGKWKSKVVPQGSIVYIELSWSSTEDDEPTGPGTMTIKLNGKTVRTQDVEQGYLTIRVNDYVEAGTSNKISVTVSDVYDNQKTIAFTVSFVEYGLTSSFNNTRAYKDDISFSYRAAGEGDKVMHFVLDGTEFLTKTVSTNNREDTITIPKESEAYPKGFEWHGHHDFRVWFVVDTGVSIITSDTLVYDLICYDEGNTTPIIASTFSTPSIMQYSNLVIPYYVYTTASQVSTVEFFIDGVSHGIQENVPRTEQSWVYRVSDTGDHIFTIKSGVTERNFPIYVEKLDVDVHAETQKLVLHLSSENRSNYEPIEQRETWEYEGIKAQFKNFNWTTDGWLRDEQNLPVMRVKDDARVIIPMKPFDINEGLFQDEGRTFEFEFATSSVFNYDTDLISCYSGNVGFKITAQQALLASSVSLIRSQYKENEHVRISFVVSKESNDRLIYCYINGIISGIVRYTTTETFYQPDPIYITIGSNDAIIDIYRIRIYKNDLSRFQMVNNWIADMQDPEELLKQYNDNNIYDNNDMISLDKVRTNLTQLPYLVIETTTTTDKKGNPVGHLPTYKGQKLLCNGYYVNPVEPRLSFSWKNGEIDVQGTSSQAYPIKNFKLKIKKANTYGKPEGKATDCSGFIMTELSEAAGKEVIFKKYSMRGYGDYVSDPTKYKNPLSIETNTFVFKADYASSEGANNVELVRYYNDYCTYQTPPQVKDNRYRQGIDGFPMIWFGDDGEKISFIGKYNFNNHKGTDEVYGLNYGGETYEEDSVSDYHRVINGAPDESWEVTDNNNMITLWRRVAGDSTKTILKDLNGRVVEYDDYLVGDNLNTVKLNSLYPMFNGAYPSTKLGDDYPTYLEYSNSWRNTYGDAETWITEMAILSIHDAGETMEEDIKEQRNFAINLMESDIREIWSLIEEYIPISPAEDMLGEKGKGESVAHAFEVRFPSEWYDSWTEGQPDVVRTDRFVGLQRWVVSTDQNKATGDLLSEPVIYEGVEYRNDTAQYRLAKFRNEFSKYFNLTSTIYYYLYTEAFLMIDSRVKNSFPTYFSVNHKVRATDADTGEYLYESTKAGDHIATGTVYYKRTGSGTEEDPYVFESFPAIVGNETYDDVGNLLWVSQMTEEETLDDNGWPLGRWCWLPYDMDTAIGINNEGLLVFDYSLEDTEGLKGSEVVPYTDPDCVPVYNGSSSVMWRNFREAFPNEIADAYKNLRAGNFGYDTIEQRFEGHQNLWPAAVFNEDAYYKYIKPLIDTGEDRLGMCLGSKEQQRKWWLFNRFRFLDSKYVAGDAVNSRISFRVNNLSGNRTIGITPYSDIYVKVKVGEQWQSAGVKTYRNQRTNVFVDIEQAGDTEAYIYSADQIKEVEGLNQNLYVSTLDVSGAINLQHLDISAPVNNNTLTALSVGANKLLRKIDARNCGSLGDTSAPHYTTSVDLTQCDQLEEAYFTGTLLQSVVLPAGGRIRKAWLPNTITSLNIENQQKVDDLRILRKNVNPITGEITWAWDTSNIKTLRISNVNHYIQQIAIDIIEGLTAGSSIKFNGFNLEVDSVADLKAFMAKLDTLHGLDTDDPSIANVSGTITVLDEDAILDWESYNRYRTRYKDVVILVDVGKTVKFYDYSGTVKLDEQVAVDPAGETGKVVYGGEDPTREDTSKIHYDWNGWSQYAYGPADEGILDNVNTDLVLYAAFMETPIYTVNFFNYNGSELIETKSRIGVGDIYFDGNFPTYSSIPVVGWGTVIYGIEDIECSADFRTLIDVDKDLNAYCIMDWPLTNLRISHNPDRINYFITEYFDTTGLEIMGTQSTPDGSIESVMTRYNYNKNKLTHEDTTMTFTVKNKSVSMEIGIGESMVMETEPIKKLYVRGDEFNPTGASLRVTFSNGQEEIKDSGFVGLTWFPTVFDELGNIEVTFNLFDLVTSTSVIVVERIYEELELNTWETISAICDAGTAQNYWHVGQTHSAFLGEFIYQTASARPQHVPPRNIYFRIVAFDHNIRYADLPDGSKYDKGDDHVYEYPEGGHTITFGLVGFIHDEILKETTLDNASISTMPMTYVNTPMNGLLPDGYLNPMYNALPEELTSKIKTVTKGQLIYGYNEEAVDVLGYIGGYVYANAISTYETKFFVPSVYEIYGNTYRPIKELDESTVCEHFEYYKTNIDDPNSRIKKNWLLSDSPQTWWTRTFNNAWVFKTSNEEWRNYYYYSIIGSNGSCQTNYSGNTVGTAPFFNL